MRFCDTPIGDDGFDRLARALRKQSVTTLQLRKCGLTDASGKAMRSLLFFHSYVQSTVEWKDSLSKNRPGSRSPILCISSLDLRDNEFTFQFIDEIHDPLIDLAIMKELDLRGNAGISSTIVADLVNRAPNTTILTGPSKQIKMPKPPPKLYRSSSSKSSLSTVFPVESPRVQKENRIQELEMENERLRTLIEYLQDGTNIVQLEPGLNIVGPRAQELVEHINKLDELLVQSHDGPSVFLSSTVAKVEPSTEVPPSQSPKRKKKKKRAKLGTPGRF